MFQDVGTDDDVVGGGLEQIGQYAPIQIGYLHPAMHSFEQPLVLVCNGGYSSSLAAANLVRLGFTNVADLIGGHTGWAAEGLSVERPHHSYLDTPSFERSDSTRSGELCV